MKGYIERDGCVIDLQGQRRIFLATTNDEDFIKNLDLNWKHIILRIEEEQPYDPRNDYFAIILYLLKKSKGEQYLVWWNPLAIKKLMEYITSSSSSKIIVSRIIFNLIDQVIHRAKERMPIEMHPALESVPLIQKKWELDLDKGNMVDVEIKPEDVTAVFEGVSPETAIGKRLQKIKNL